MGQALDVSCVPAIFKSFLSCQSIVHTEAQRSLGLDNLCSLEEHVEYYCKQWLNVFSTEITN